MGFAKVMTVAATSTVLGVCFWAPLGVSAQSADDQPPTVRVSFGAGVDIPVNKNAKPELLSKEKSDVDGDGIDDTVSYFDTDGEDGVDSEVIDLGSTGKPSILAIRCDADHDGRYDDWLVVDAKTEQPRAALVDSDDDGDVDRVAFADGTTEAVDAAQGDLFRPVANN